MPVRSPFTVAAGLAPEGLPGVRRAIHAGLAHVFGPPPFDAGAAPGDPGLFGPESVSWRVIAEPAAIVGGVRALLVQLMHPHAMAGVADHSGFADDPLGRLQRTSGYVTTTTFGSTAEALAAARQVRRAHRTVRGTAPDGQPYRASDPRLLAWVQIALTSSFLGTHRAYAPVRLAHDEADRFVLEQSRAAALLDPVVDLDEVDPHDLDRLPLLADGWLPTTVAELEAAIVDHRPQLGVNAQGRAALRFLVWPSIDPAVRAGYVPLLAAAVATLEPWQRRLLGLRLGRVAPRVAAAQARAGLLAVRIATGRSPSFRAAAARAGASG